MFRQNSDYLGCCCSGRWVQVTSTPLSFTTTIEQRSDESCASCASSEAETVLFRSVTNASLTRGACCDDRLEISTVGDRRLLAYLLPDASRIPSSIAIAAYETLKEGWAASRRKVVATSGKGKSKAKESTRLLNDDAETKSLATKPVIVPMSNSSTLALHAAGLFELMESQGCCCVREKTQAMWSNDVNFARASNAGLQLGIRGGNIVEISSGMRSAKQAADAIILMSLQRSQAENPRAVFESGDSCCAPSAVLSVGTDITRLEESTGCCSSSMTVMRSRDVPWIYTRKSSTQCLSGLISLLLFCVFAFFLASSTFIVDSPVSSILYIIGSPFNFFFVSRLYSRLFGALLVDLMAFVFFYTFTGLPSLHAIGSLCCRFTSVVVGTTGAAGARTPPCCPWCRSQEPPLIIVTCDNGRGGKAADFVANAERALYDSMMVANDESAGADKGEYFPTPRRTPQEVESQRPPETATYQYAEQQKLLQQQRPIRPEYQQQSQLQINEMMSESEKEDAVKRSRQLVNSAVSAQEEEEEERESISKSKGVAIRAGWNNKDEANHITSSPGIPPKAFQTGKPLWDRD